MVGAGALRPPTTRVTTRCKWAAAPGPTIGTAGWPTAMKSFIPPVRLHSNTSAHLTATASRTSTTTAIGTHTVATAAAGGHAAWASAGRLTCPANGFSTRVWDGPG